MNSNASKILASFEAVEQQLIAKKEQLRYLQSIDEILDTGSTGSDTESKRTAKILEKTIVSDINSLLADKCKLLDAFERLSKPQYQTVLLLKYFCGLNMDEIAQRMHYTTRHIQRLHGLAIKELCGEDIPKRCRGMPSPTQAILVSECRTNIPTQ